MDELVASLVEAGLHQHHLWASGALAAALLVVVRRDRTFAAQAGATAAGALLGSVVLGWWLGAGPTALGLLAGGGLVALFWGPKHLDGVVMLGCVSLGLARLGCMLEACHGGPLCKESSWWCIRPVQGSAMWWMQHQMGYIGLDWSRGLPMAPGPLWQALWAWACAAVAAGGRRMGRPAGWSAMLAAWLLLQGRMASMLWRGVEAPSSWALLAALACGWVVVVTRLDRQ